MLSERVRLNDYIPLVECLYRTTYMIFPSDSVMPVSTVVMPDKKKLPGESKLHCRNF